MGNHDTTNRIGYIDLVKGISIICVVWVHSHIPPFWLTSFLVNFVFFFISGLFFNRQQKSLRKLIIKNYERIIIPFLFFYIASYPFRLIVHFWDNRTLSTFDWLCILDVFSWNPNPDYLFVNVPLWFLLCLFFINIFYFTIRKLPDAVIILISIVAIFSKSFFYSIPAPFMINVAFYWLGIFALGNVFGTKMVAFLQMQSNKCVSIILCILIAILISSVYLGCEDVSYINPEMSIYINAFVVIFVLFSASSLVDDKYTKVLRFYGTNSLIVLGFHIWALIPIGRILYAIFRKSNIATGMTATFFTVLIAIVFIKFCNNRIPRLVGKNTPPVKCSKSNC